jgi:hypothetical protein
MAIETEYSAEYTTVYPVTAGSTAVPAPVEAHQDLGGRVGDLPLCARSELHG